MRHVVLICALALTMPLIAIPSTCLAQASEARDDEARGNFRLGSAAYAQGRYEDARRYFARAYELSKRPQLHYNIAQAHDRLRQDEQALAAYQAFLRESGPSPHRQGVKARVAILEKVIREKRRLSAAGSSVPESGAKTTSTKTGPAVAVDAPPEESSRGSRLGPYLLAGAGGALLAGGLVTGLLTNTAERELEDNCPDDDCSGFSGYQSTVQRGRNMKLTTNVLLATGAATVGAGVVWWLLGGTETTSDARASVSCLTDGCVAHLWGSF